MHYVVLKRLTDLVSERDWHDCVMNNYYNKRLTENGVAQLVKAPG